MPLTQERLRTVNKIMNHTKYITFTNEHDVPDIIIFTWCQKHSHIAAALQMKDSDILGAGFIQFYGEPEDRDVVDSPQHVVPHCYGDSSTLKVKSRGAEDDRVAIQMLELSEASS